MSFTAPIKDSGTRANFETGAVRDNSTGKGRMDLLPPAVLIQLSRPSDFPNSFSGAIAANGAATAQVLLAGFMVDFNPEALLEALRHLLYEIEIELGTEDYHFIENTLDEFSSAIIELAKHFEKGAIKYAARNWEKGINLSRYWDSAYRHLTQYLREDKDEPHLVAAAWNVACLYQTGVWIQQGILPASLNDLPTTRVPGRTVTLAPAKQEAAGQVVGIATGPVFQGQAVAYVRDLSDAESVQDVILNIVPADTEEDKAIEAYQNAYEEGFNASEEAIVYNDSLILLTAEELGGYDPTTNDDLDTDITTVLTILAQAHPEKTNPVDSLIAIATDFAKVQRDLAKAQGKLNVIHSNVEQNIASRDPGCNCGTCVWLRQTRQIIEAA